MLGMKNKPAEQPEVIQKPTDGIPVPSGKEFLYADSWRMAERRNQIVEFGDTTRISRRN